MHLHEFLGHVNEIVKPKTYLEIGVQHGYSLNQAHTADIAIGIDPQPLTKATGNQEIFTMTSDTYFDPVMSHGVIDHVDLAFVDGLHHAEQAMRDFLNICSYLSDTGVIVIDDVLPRNEIEADRFQCPGDWTGDVWKMAHVLHRQSEVESLYVNTQPTGVLVVTGATHRVLDYLWEKLPMLTGAWQGYLPVPPEILNREDAWEPLSALEELRSMR
jgi:predicted O-methyltransferase YrrM